MKQRMMFHRSMFVVLLFCVALGPAIAETPSTRVVETLPQTYGVNYEFVDTSDHPDFLSSAPLTFSAVAMVGGQEVNMRSGMNGPPPPSSCSGPCNAQLHGGHDLINCALGDGFNGKTLATCQVQVLRFAQTGRVEEPMGFDWLVVMVDDKDLAGTLETTLGDKGLDYPAEVALGGRMAVTVQPDGMPPMRLLSRKEPIFKGQTPGWPPHGMKLELSNPPIDYFLADQIDNPEAKPFMSVTSNTVKLGEEKSSFFAVRPEITRAKAGRRGVALRWTSTEKSVEAVTLTHYNVYRNDEPGNLKTWKKIATVPITTTRYLDRENKAAQEAEYVVSHAAEYPFGYSYEGIFEDPVQVKAR